MYFTYLLSNNNLNVTYFVE